MCWNGVGAKSRRQAFVGGQELRGPIVVSIEKGNKVAAGLAYAPVARRRDPAIRLPDQAHTRITHSGHAPRPIVSRAVVDHDHFMSRVPRLQNRRHGPFNIGLLVVEGNDCRDPGLPLVQDALPAITSEVAGRATRTTRWL